MRYDIMFVAKNIHGERKITVMDFKGARMITFLLEELNGDDMDQELKDFTLKHLDKIAQGYFDYTAKHTNAHKKL
jgi:hypothetical protein